ncbi:hypothetical protein JCM19231_4773 [Vibrio ishigakensis]|uniref:Uncharacterized protein n=1 Tax=Vibrio ishigakensis TaxID=1481914 RepID=A0A0B8NZ59_9VIBR|nr:hypothetical protein JCM19231_4773 [Vibrio ishigakensis]
MPFCASFSFNQEKVYCGEYFAVQFGSIRQEMSETKTPLAVGVAL